MPELIQTLRPTRENQNMRCSCRKNPGGKNAALDSIILAALRVVGGHGDDVLDGGDGIDLAVFSGSIANYVARTANVDGVTQVMLTAPGAAETDTMTGIEYLQIGCRYFDLQSTLTQLPEAESVALADVVVEVAGTQLLAAGVMLLV